MKLTFTAAFAALLMQPVHGHATFQQLWVNGSNSPIGSVTSNDIRCNAGTRPVSGKCSVAAGQTVTLEMHQQPNDRNCANEGIGGNHYGPVMAYLSQVSDSSTADGSSGWFKIFQDGWKKNPSGYNGDDDYWGVKDLNLCCGKINVKIPSNIPSGDYLLRAEVIALHSAAGSGGAQPYVTCFQLTVTGGSGSIPATVNFPGAYSASDPGILVNIHTPMTNYVVPGPAVISGGTTKEPGSSCSGCESTCKASLKRSEVQW
ncbi:unnamed protein product [Clonostachys chloroleuca]|uniref:lytic cellulose monooxygenase (C4-dehydrogenating) n=1 Tax=Clonostachys chloroleuca TaxID=1926264 RepID=A0AA35QD13_9HYPO|nr:unnamed protein product [Clonostachys chloroleuca]